MSKLRKLVNPLTQRKFKTVKNMKLKEKKKIKESKRINKQVKEMLEYGMSPECIQVLFYIWGYEIEFKEKGDVKYE